MNRYFLLLFLFISSVSLGQQGHREPAYALKLQDPVWVQLMYVDAPDPIAVREAYEAYYAIRPVVKNRDTQYYKRFMRSERLHGGDPSLRQGSSRNAAWQEAGPWHYDPEAAMSFPVQSPGACHVYVVEQSASNPQHVWAGTATAGLWQSVNKGHKWQLMTKDLPVTEVYSVAIDPFDSELIYFGEGNGTVWRSMNGGLNWFMTGDADFQSEDRWVRELSVKPDANHVVFAATDDGLFRSEDFAENWTMVLGGDFMEVEYHPANPDTVYAVRRQSNTTQFLRSVNAGVSFSIIGDGFPFAISGQDQQRTEISVSAAAPDRIYALAAGEANGGSGLFGIYISEDAGENWTFQCCGTGPAGPPDPETNPNILGWQGNGSEEGGQYYYDLAQGVSPTDPDRLFGAGISVWRSLDAGQNWELNGHWVTWAGEFTMDRYTHADVHDVKFFQTADGTDMWIASDGGIYYSADQGDHIEPRMYGLHGTDFWGFQAGFKQGDVMAGGTYHNGTLIRNGDLYHWGLTDSTAGGWLAELAGDNFRGFINPANAKIGYHDGGSFRFSDDRLERITSRPFDQSKLPNTSYVTGEYGNLEWDPHCMNYIYSPVGSVLWKTEDGGMTWAELHDFSGDKIIQVKVSPADPDVICVTHKVSSSQWRIKRTEDGGDNWTDITPAQALSGGNADKAKQIEMHATNPDIMWALSVGNFNSPNGKIWITDDGGLNWMDQTANLTEENLLSIVHQAGTASAVYVGTRNSVFYRDNTMTEWEPFNAGLPAITPAFFLQADYCGGRIRTAGTRSVHESPLNVPSNVIARFMADRLVHNTAGSCTPLPVRFYDTSVLTCAGATYEWEFPGGEPEFSTEMNPEVFYSEPGLYNVSLTVTDAEGNSSALTRTDFVHIIHQPYGSDVWEDFDGPDFPPSSWKVHDPEGNGAWEHGTEPGNPANRMAQFPNYWVDTEGQTDLLLFPPLDWSFVNAPHLTFEYSYHTFESYEDGLALVYRTGADSTWVTLWEASGPDLHVDGNYIWFWYDEGGTPLWEQVTLFPAELTGESCIQFAFKNLGGGGNHIWVDNVNIIDISVDELSASEQLSLWPNPARATSTIRIPGARPGDRAEVFNALGRSVMQIGLTGTDSRLDVSALSAGWYSVRVVTEGKVKMGKLIKQ